VITLRPYQEEAREFLLTHPRSILADEPGVGKSYPAIEAGLATSSQKLIVVPSYLKYNWRRYLEEDYGLTGVVVADGEREQREEAIRSDSEWIIINYEMLARPMWDPEKKPGPAYEYLLKDNDAFRKGHEWGTVIFDEAHRLRGRNSLWTKAAYKVRSRYNWSLTGTPVVNNPGDFFPLLKMIDPKTFTSYWRFVRNYCWVEYNGFSWDVKHVRPEMLRPFRELIYTYMLRRKLDDVLPDIPSQLETIIDVPLEPKWLKAHQEAKKNWVLEHPSIESVDIASIGELIITLRKITGVLSEAKLRATMDLIEDRQSEPIVVFVWFKDSGDRLYEEIQRKFTNRPVVYVSGDDPPQKRSRMVDQWRNAEGGPILIATIASLMEGENLQRAAHCIMYEEDYLPANNDQAVARLRRSGQKRPVHVYHLHCTKTIDESVHRIAQVRDTHTAKLYVEEVFADDDASEFPTERGW